MILPNGTQVSFCAGMNKTRVEAEALAYHTGRATQVHTYTGEKLAFMPNFGSWYNAETLQAVDVLKYENKNLIIAGTDTFLSL